MKDLLSYHEAAQRLDYKDTRIVRKLVKQGVLTPVYLAPGSRPRIHSAQWTAYLQQLQPDTADAPQADPLQAQDDLLALMHRTENQP